jgi:hypothetical protein
MYPLPAELPLSLAEQLQIMSTYDAAVNPQRINYKYVNQTEACGGMKWLKLLSGFFKPQKIDKTAQRLHPVRSTKHTIAINESRLCYPIKASLKRLAAFFRFLRQHKTL